MILKLRLTFVMSVISLSCMVTSCTQVRILAPDSREADAAISPRQALDAAKPHLDVIFHLRCNRRADKSWCSKPTQDFIARESDWYCITRESYPFKTTQAYWDPCVRVHVQTGRIVLPTLPDL